MWWHEPVTTLKGIGAKKAIDFKKLNVETIGDVLNMYPRLDCYIDYSRFKKIRELATNNEKQIFEAFHEKHIGNADSHAVAFLEANQHSTCNH